MHKHQVRGTVQKVGDKAQAHNVDIENKRESGDSRLGMSANLEQRGLSGHAEVSVANVASAAAQPGLYGILMLDLLGTINFCNATFGSMAGCNANQLLGNPVNDVFPDLPLSRKSPDGNRAMVTSRFGRERWWPHRLALADHRHCLVDICILPVTAGGGMNFVLEARPGLLL